MPSTAMFITDADEDELSPPKTLGGGEPDIGVAETDGALLYTLRFVREGAEWITGGMSRDGDGMGMGVPTCEGVPDFDRRC